jgi:hypothetical protein
MAGWSRQTSHICECGKIVKFRENGRFPGVAGLV